MKWFLIAIGWSLSLIWGLVFLLPEITDVRTGIATIATAVLALIVGLVYCMHRDVNG